MNSLKTKSERLMKKACIVIPTYNEAENIEPLIEKIFSITPKIKGWDTHILVVDDKSPDGTGKIVDKLIKSKNNQFKKLHLLEGNKQGLGVAYVRGFKHAKEILAPDVLFEMDADFSHPPKLIPEFLKRIENGAEFVIGSRYIPGGDTPDWNITRKTISKGGNFFARIVAGIYEIHDCTSGFRAISTNLLKRINLNALGAKGYSFQMNLLYEAKRQKAKFSEVPLVFPDRTKGKSKMSHKDLLEFFFNSFRLRLRTWNRLIKFCIVGGSGVIVNMGFFYLFNDVLSIDEAITSGLPLQTEVFFASALAVQIAIIWNFLLNNKWTFKKSTNKSNNWIKFWKFEKVSLVGMAINVGVLLIFNNFLGIQSEKLAEYLGQFVGIIVATGWNYLANVKYTWRNE